MGHLVPTCGLQIHQTVQGADVTSQQARRLKKCPMQLKGLHHGSGVLLAGSNAIWKHLYIRLQQQRWPQHRETTIIIRYDLSRGG